MRLCVISKNWIPYFEKKKKNISGMLCHVIFSNNIHFICFLQIEFVMWIMIHQVLRYNNHLVNLDFVSEVSNKLPAAIFLVLSKTL